MRRSRLAAFAAYLKGMETRYGADDGLDNLEFAAYLKGMETRN